MKGYFSQLAQHTWPNTGPMKSSAASRFSIQAEGAGGTRPTPLDVEEIRFTESPPTTAAALHENYDESLSYPVLMYEPRLISEHKVAPDVPETPTAVISESKSDLMNVHEAARHKVELSSQNKAELFSEPSLRETQRTGTESRAPLYQEEQGKETAFIYEHEAAPLNIEQAVSTEDAASTELFESIEAFESEFAGDVNRRGQSTLERETRLFEAKKNQEMESLSKIEEQTGESGYEQRGEAAYEHESRESTYQSYLRDIREWVSATPEVEERKMEGPGPRMIERDENLLVVKRELEGPQVAREPEVQDLNLSIGTISVVIEEPRTEAQPAQASTAARAESTRAGVTSKPTSLSRYYLRSW